MKQKIFTFSLVGFLLLSFAIPTFAASSSYSYTMSHRVVDGSSNGQYHKLDKGKVTINGTAKISSSEKGADTTNLINYQLCNKTSGNCFGTVSSRPNKNGSATSFSGTYSSVGGGSKYYLMIYRSASDGHTIKGSGKVSN